MYNLPEYVDSALNTLKSAGFEAYIVGGGLRDMILGLNPDDYDITTSAKPEQVIKLFEKTVKTGIKHGTVTVIIDKKPIEVTTFRADGSYSNHRSPDSVEFLASLDGDLSRRDFTVNALAYNKEKGVVDLFGGIEDIKHKILRAVGNPEKRFCEDALRILRLFRFSAKLNFNIEEDTLRAAQSCAALLQNVSRERIFSELIKILLCDNPAAIKPLLICGGLDFLDISAKDYPLEQLSELPAKRELRFFAFCFICSVNPCELCRSLKADRALEGYCHSLALLESSSLSHDKIGIKNMLRITNEECTADYMLLTEKLYNRESALPLLESILASGEAYKLHQLNISGEDLMSLGFKGEKIGEALNNLLTAVIDCPDLNTHSSLIETAEKLK